MNKATLLGQRQYFDMVHNVTLRAIEGFSNAELDYRPADKMRSPRELIYHIYTSEKVFADGVQKGKIDPAPTAAIGPEDESAKATLDSLDTVAKLQAYARDCHNAANEAVQALSDEDLARMVESPFGSFPGWQFFAFAYDEHWHHRGQLYTYLRLLGKEPLMLYSYED